MSESDLGAGTAAPAADAGDLSAGRRLRQAREAAGLHVAALAVAMKVPVKKLEALEADRYSELPDAVFVRALASSVCRALKVDATPILARLPQSGAPVLGKEERGVAVPYPSSGLFRGNPIGGLASRPALLLVFLLLLAALAVAFFPDPSSLRRWVEPEAAAPVSMAAPMEPRVVDTQSSAAADATKAPGAASAAALATSASLASSGLAPQAGAVPAAVAASVSGAASAAAGATLAPSVPVANAGIVAFRATNARAWVKVTDSRGKVQFEKTLAAGESASSGGELPLTVVVGNVSATEVVVRGQPFAMDDWANNNVARFEVK